VPYSLQWCAVLNCELKPQLGHIEAEPVEPIEGSDTELRGHRASTLGPRDTLCGGDGDPTRVEGYGPRPRLMIDGVELYKREKWAALSGGSLSYFSARAVETARVSSK
jgi:hypothetical protein